MHKILDVEVIAARQPLTFGVLILILGTVSLDLSVLKVDFWAHRHAFKYNYGCLEIQIYN